MSLGSSAENASVVRTVDVFTVVSLLLGLQSCDSLTLNLLKHRLEEVKVKALNCLRGLSVCILVSLTEGASSVPAFFSEDDSQSNDSSDSDSSSSQSDDVDQETFLLDEPLERTSSSSHANSAAQAPRSMQWAVRNTPSQRASGNAPSSSSAPAG